MVILYKCSADLLPTNIDSTHSWSRILEYALYSMEDQFILFEGAKADDGGSEDPRDKASVTQEHIDFVDELLTKVVANPQYLTSSVS
jgi:hypothetical protein